MGGPQGYEGATGSKRTRVQPDLGRMQLVRGVAGPSATSPGLEPEAAEAIGVAATMLYEAWGELGQRMTAPSSDLDSPSVETLVADVAIAREVLAGAPETECSEPFRVIVDDTAELLAEALLAHSQGDTDASLDSYRQAEEQIAFGADAVVTVTCVGVERLDGDGH